MDLLHKHFAADAANQAGNEQEAAIDGWDVDEQAVGKKRSKKSSAGAIKQMSRAIVFCTYRYEAT